MSYKDVDVFIHILFQMQYRCKVSILLLLETFLGILRFMLTVPPRGKRDCPSEHKQVD